MSLAQSPKYDDTASGSCLTDCFKRVCRIILEGKMAFIYRIKSRLQPSGSKHYSMNIREDNASLEEGSGNRVYVIVSQSCEDINDRVAKVMSLKNTIKDMVLVTASCRKEDSADLAVSPIYNPTGILRILRLSNLKRAIDKIIFFPSTKILYVRAVVYQLTKRITEDLRHNRSVTVMTCVPSHDLCIAGLMLKKKFPEIRWIIDWQDLWSYDENYFNRIPKSYRNRLLTLERGILSKSDLNITTNQYAKRVLEQHYGVPSERVVAIYHHFDRGDLQGVELAEKTPIDGVRNKIKLGFLGTLVKPPRVPGARLICAVQALRDKEVDAELHLFGNAPGRAVIPCSFDARTLVVYGRSTHEESLKRLMQCDALILALADLPNCRAVMSIKLPHYLMLNRPIIAIVPEQSAIADIIRETGSGYVVPANEDWSMGLEAVVRQLIQGEDRSSRRADAIEQFSWQRISLRWVEVLKGIKLAA